MAKQARDFDWNSVHPWAKMAYEHGKANETWFAIKHESPEFDLWARYFHKLGWAPLTFKRLAMEENPNAVWTAPAQFPEWLPDFKEWNSNNGNRAA